MLGGNVIISSFSEKEMFVKYRQTLLFDQWGETVFHTKLFETIFEKDEWRIHLSEILQCL